MQTEWGQTWLVHQVTGRLSRELQSKIRIDRVRIGFFNKLNLEGVLVEDRKRDTLLAAGLVQVRITDWFFLKDKADLEYIGLKNATIKLQRTDSVWNYRYLVDYFASPSTGKKKESGIDFSLKKVVLENIRFTQHDAWKGDDLYARVGRLDMDAKQLSLTGKVFDIDRLLLDGFVYHEFGYKGARPRASKVADSLRPAPKDTATLRWNPGRMYIHVAQLQLKNAQFRSDKDGILGSKAPYFDGRHIDFNGITGNLQNLSLVHDTMRARVDLVAKERGGLLVRTLRGNLNFNPGQMEFRNLLIRTNNSTLRDYFVMRFGSFADLSDFADKVRMEGHFDNSLITSDDIAIFAPDLKSWKRQFYIDGKIRGMVDAFDGENVKLRTGQTALNGNFTVQGLTDPAKTFLNIEARDLVTNYHDAVTFIPDLRSVTMPNLRKLGTIRFTGTYTGFFKDFVAFGTLHTALGSLKTDLNMKLPDRAAPVYSGSVSTGAFNLGQFFNNSDLGIVDFHGDLKGRGFTRSQLDLDINGTIHRFQFRGYTYRNITAKGRIDANTFNGDFGIKDPNVEGTVKGLVTFGGPEPTFNATANIVKGNLRALGLASEDLSLNGRFALNLTGRSLADFTGTANITDAVLLQGGRRLSFDSLYVSSTYAGGARTLRIRSNELDALVHGQFDIPSLPEAVQLFLHQYYPAYIKSPHRSGMPKQSFTFEIRTGIIEDYLKIFDKRLSGGNNSQVRGALDLGSNTLTLDAQVPAFGYKQFNFSDIRLFGNGNLSQLRLEGEVGNSTVSDSVTLPQTKFSIQVANDVSDISITTTSNQAINEAALSARVNTYSDGLSVLFNKSTFVLNGKTWSIAEGGTLDFRRNTVTQGDVVLRESNQEIRLSTRPSEEGANLNDLVIDLKDLNLSDVMPFVAPKNRIEGLANGRAVIEDPANRFFVTSDLRFDQLRVDNDSIGQLQASGSYNKKTGKLLAKGNNVDPNHRIAFDVNMDLDSASTGAADRIQLEAVNYSVKYLENFLGSLFSEMQGFVTGNLEIRDPRNNPRYVGRARLKDASMKVNFTQVKYWLYDADIELEENRINFGRLRLRDDSVASVAERAGRTATVTGAIEHTGFKNMVFDLALRTDDGPIQLLNTTYADNQTFYGRARGTGSMTLSGPQSAMNMEINIKASERDSSYITLPPSRSRETGAADFLVERKYGTEMTPETFRNEESNIHYSLNLTANPMVNVEVILDDLTGDAIKGRGTGDLFIESGTNEPLAISGRYNIEEGSYLFTFQSFFKKPFELRKGANNFIEWTGDPYNARIRFEAIYKAENVRFAPLVTSLSLNDDRLERMRGDVNVVAILTGDLFRPDFAFHLEFPNNSPVYTNPSFAYGLQEIEKNTNEINKQVTYLIVFNSFAPVQTGTDNSSAGTLNEFAYSTISGLFFGEVNRLLNQVLGKVLANNKVTLNFSGSLYNRNLLNQTNRGFGINQSTLNVSLSAPIAGERVQITFGGSFDVPIPGNNDISQRVYIYPDVSIDVLINPTGSIRATFFYSQSPDLISGSTNPVTNKRVGAKLSYRKEFDSLKDLFRKKKKEQPVDSTSVNREADINSAQKQR
ncbi:hypothetical protein EPD60_15890 [Flaviaesturariibacter flavus]|uniref:Translocation and assembly module TamB C-terminal domain-containing protein n=1 Tax=Flaviaesturariibacter flavus TaxID=2502780 RepID=A0A4R1B637_9BACT|nr:translocation/assembly module TamB domain-containing protein [Flaviaesturariibacter flavus]TCJ12037.1 hypothetical protein EPD60_15890 [Flaviaesturariibacter flavus]